MLKMYIIIKAALIGYYPLFQYANKIRDDIRFVESHIYRRAIHRGIKILKRKTMLAKKRSVYIFVAVLVSGIKSSDS